MCIKVRMLALALLVVQASWAHHHHSPILEKETSGGFTSTEYLGYGHQVLIYDNGEVVSRDRLNAHSPWHDRLIALLPSDVINRIIEDLLATTDHGALVFPDTPMCTDAPSHQYSAINGQDEMVIFAQTINCRTGFLDAYRHLWLQELLDGFDRLSQF